MLECRKLGNDKEEQNDKIKAVVAHIRSFVATSVRTRLVRSILYRHVSCVYVYIFFSLSLYIIFIIIYL